MIGKRLFIILTLMLLPSICMAESAIDEIRPYDIVILKSDHFTVRYPKNAEVYARKTINYAEYAYDILSKRLDATVDRITIQLFDRGDVYLDYPVMDFGDGFTLYLWPPESVLEYPYFGGWLEEEIASHIARILIQRTYKDFIHSYNNLILPLWYLDGLSNLYTFPEEPGLPKHHGLIRAIVHSAARDHALPDYSTLMSDKYTWLGNSSGEIYGSVFLDNIISEYGYEMINEWNKFNVSNFRSIEHNSKIIFGKRWSELYGEWVEKEQKAVNDYVVEKHYLTKPFLHEYPQVIPGKNAISFVRNDGLHQRGIASYDLDTKKTVNIVKCEGECEHHWSSDGKKLYFTTLIKTSHYESETLYVLEEGSHFPVKLPIPGHVRGFAEDNGHIYVVTLLNNAPQIYYYSITDDEYAKLIYTAPSFSLIEGITAIQNGQLIASYYDPDKKQFDLIRITPFEDTVEIQPITDNVETEMYPFVMKDNNIGYVTEDDGYFYLNRISVDGHEHSVFHKHDTALVQPVQAENGAIYYTNVDYKGMSIAELSSDQFVIEETDLEAKPVKHEDTSIILAESRAIYPDKKTIPNVETEYHDSFDWSVLIPSSYLPSLGRSDSQGWHLGVSLENSDYLNHHSYEVAFSWYFQTKVFDLVLSYLWKRYRWYLSAKVDVEQKTYLVDTGKKYEHYPLTKYSASLSTGTDYHFPLLDMELSFTLLAEHTRTNDHSMDALIQQWVEQINDKSDNFHHRWTNGVIANLKLQHTHDVPKSIPGKIGYEFEYELRFEPPFFSNYTYSFSNIFRLDMAWSMPWRMVDVLSLSLLYGVAITGKPYRYLLEVETGSGFDFNYFGFSDLVSFHGIRSGNLLANNHLIHCHLNYAFPIIYFDKNYLKIPLMINRIGLGLVGDWAVKSDDISSIDFFTSMFGLGGEIYIDITTMYNYPIRLGFGYERGFAKSGENSYYLWIGL